MASLPRLPIRLGLPIFQGDSKVSCWRGLDRRFSCYRRRIPRETGTHL